MYRTLSGLFLAAVFLSFSFARAENPGQLVPDRPVGITAEHQSNDEADVTITLKIRQAVVKDDDLSLYAQNVKIITVDGQVVLKGPVRSEQEKLKVERLAQEIAGKDSVRSEIEVAPW
ncbi:MAG TPA: BON domain-containing protein [Oligoflexus sp.]|uniref:BON domain-containing protein n=1 Tax=Oligoflexus sp. TaxID=1971216 RepID=UPI002D7FF63B|nr:BON domain-containing protein [Oligoflexus sp.]HET9241142.1 BON domain-containing protein [Oligoflexus sp.]